MADLLQLERVSFVREGRLDDRFSLMITALSLAPEQVLGVVGPSGCGKSTMIDLLALLRRPTALARFDLLGRSIARLWASGGVAACTAFRAQHIGVVLQTGGLLPNLNALENILAPQRLLGKPDRAHVGRLMESLGIAELATRLPAQLSTGQRQRVAIARALSHRPALVLADEPTASLGVEHGPRAMQLLLENTRQTGAALVIVSHDHALLAESGIETVQCHVDDDGVRMEA
ncbi:MAG: ATP-binding cassette domain-containing protein [Burkholderiaceae bacterium]|nr:ATP-binding cassette domain-containing protein [Burkholderiaceae bacterium]